LKNTAYLVLESGQVFKGKRFGADRNVTGEIVFTTGMTGYLETLTNPGYYGQIVVQTFPLVGNYGVIPSEFESGKSHLKAYIVREWCQDPSNFRSEGNLDAFLKSMGIVGLYDIDTRALTRIIRKNGVMNARITSSLDDHETLTENIKKYGIQNPIESVSCSKTTRFAGDNPLYNVVLWDFGFMKRIKTGLERRGCAVTIVPAFSKAAEIAALKPNGVVLSNGPGNPAEYSEIVSEVAKLADMKIPLLGISLGHQFMALSQGAKTERLKYGHRGSNHPVRDLSSGRLLITEQSHQYVVIGGAPPENAKVRYINTNDGTVEGIDYARIPAFSVQFYPDGAVFDRFINLMKGVG
jgi:carbamoyl-phosphate synthase small subunit